MQRIHFRIGRAIGPGEGRPYEVRRLRRALLALGYGERPRRPAGRYDAALAAAVTAFQRDFGLKPDGIVQPGGPTEGALGLALGDRIDGGLAALARLRDSFAALASAGLRFTPMTRSYPRPHVFVDRRGVVVPPARLRTILAGERRGRGAAADPADRNETGRAAPECDSLSPPVWDYVLEKNP